MASTEDQSPENIGFQHSRSGVQLGESLNRADSALQPENIASGTIIPKDGDLDLNVIALQGIQGTTGAQGFTGTTGPSAISEDADNSLTLGTDSLLYYDGSLATSALQPANIASGTITPKDGDLDLNNLGGIAGSTGSTDNVLLRADGTGGSTIQAGTGVTIPPTYDDNGDLYATGLNCSYFGTATQKWARFLFAGGFKSFSLGSDVVFGWEAGQTGAGNPVTRLYRDGADHIIGQRNGANPQEFRLYNTYTDASNYERASFKHDDGFVLDYEYAGTGQEPSTLLNFRNNGTRTLRVMSDGSFEYGEPNQPTSWNFKLLGWGTGRTFGFNFNGGVGINVTNNEQTCFTFSNEGITTPYALATAKCSMNSWDNNVASFSSSIWGVSNPSGIAVYGAMTYAGANTSPTHYERFLAKWDNNIFKMTTDAGGDGTACDLQIDSAGDILMPNLPTSDPVKAGALWNNGGILTVSAG